MAILTLLVALAASSGCADAAAGRARVFRIALTKAPTTRPLADGFLGLGLEYNTIPRWVGTGSQAGNPVLTQLIRNLDPTGRVVVRIGGQSTDRTWWPVPGMRRPLGVTYNLTPAWAASARKLAQAIDGNLLLGVNLEANQTRIDQVEAAQLVKRVGRNYIGALEIGNEPALYAVVPWYKRLGRRPLPWYSHIGTPVHARARGYGPADFVREFERTLGVLSGLPVAGPETGNLLWFKDFRQFLRPHSQVRMLTSHAYGLNNCVTHPSSPQYPSIPHLLSLSASNGLLSGAEPYVALAHRVGASYRVDEMGSVSCNGRAGVSNTMASALWVMDALFWTARKDADGVNLHTYPNSVNGLFDFRRSHRRWEATVHPLYYGALMFAQAAPAGSRLLRINSRRQQQLRAWATLAPDHRIRVLLINDSLSSREQALVSAPLGFGSAAGSVERLTASSAHATRGLTLGGRSFGVGTATGMLSSPLPQTVKPHKRSYSVTLPASSAALLTLTSG